MMKKLSLVLVLSLVLSLCVPFSARAAEFEDAPSWTWFGDAVAWAVEEEITNGTSATTFSPDLTCTRAQILTFLWRAAGRPAPLEENLFPDVEETAYYASAACWAREQGLVSGETFEGDAPCARSDVALYLWLLAGSPAVGGGSYYDVPDSAPYAEAVRWAFRQGITTGTGNACFSPEDTCTRAQIVTFLFRAYAKPLFVSLPQVECHTRITDTKGKPLDLRHSIPVFLGGGEGYVEINRFFRDLEAEFFGPNDSSAQRIVNSIQDGDVPAGARFIDTVTLGSCTGTEKLASAALEYAWYMGGVLDYGANGYTFDAVTGRRLTLPQVAEAQADWVITDNVISQLRAQYPGLMEEDSSVLRTLREMDVADMDFYVEDSTIHVVFDKYEITYGAMGMFDVTLTLPIKSQYR